jgi:hypothetical protein
MQERFKVTNIPEMKTVLQIAVLLAAVVCVSCVTASDADASPRYYVHSGYFGIHKCTAPACTDYNVLVQGYAGQAPYASSVQVDVKRNQIYWYYWDASAQPHPFIGAASLTDGKPIVPGATDYAWIPRDKQDSGLAFDEYTGLLYVMDNSRVIYSLNPDNKQFTFVTNVTFSPYSMWVTGGKLWLTSTNSCKYPQQCQCVYSIVLDGKSQLQKVICQPDAPLPYQSAIVGYTAQHAYIADPNVLTVFILDMGTGKQAGTLDLSVVGNMFVGTITFDLPSNSVFFCGTNRADFNQRLLYVVNMTSNQITYSNNLGIDSCMGGYVTGQPLATNVPSVTEVAPASFPQVFEGNVLVSGSGFLKGSSLQCRFGGAVVTNAIYHMDSVIECQVPSSPVAGKALLQVTNDGLLWSNDQVFVEYTSV